MQRKIKYQKIITVAQVIEDVNSAKWSVQQNLPFIPDSAIIKQVTHQADADNAHVFLLGADFITDNYLCSFIALNSIQLNTEFIVSRDVSTATFCVDQDIPGTLTTEEGVLSFTIQYIKYE